MSFNQLLAENPLPFTICMKNVDETKPSSDQGVSAGCQRMTSSLDEVIQVLSLKSSYVWHRLFIRKTDLPLCLRKIGD